jgi:hypothetical protein
MLKKVLFGQSQRRIITATTFALIAVALVLAGCENPSGGTVTTALIDQTGSTGSLSITYNSQLSEFMEKGKFRNFKIATGKKVDWKVEGGTGSGTAIDQNGRLFIGEDETSITLTVRATAVDNPEEWGEREIKVRGWHEITENLKAIFEDIGCIAYNGSRWVAGGDDPASTPGWIIPAIAYSDDNGETWTKTENFTKFAGEYWFTAEEAVCSLIYDGPEGDKKFLLGTYCANVFWSYDGITWTKDVNVFNSNWPFARMVGELVYGEVDVNGVPTGMYIATSTTDENAYTTDTRDWAVGGKRWKTAPRMMQNLTWKGTPVDPPPYGRVMDIQYGTGMVDGIRRGIFFAQRIAVIRTNPSSPFPQETDMYLYSTDGFSWEALATKIDVSTNDRFNGYWFSPVDKAGLATLAFQPAPPAGGSAWIYEFRPQIDTKGETLFAGNDAYSKEVKFALTGGGYIMAAGQGNRLAIAHEGAYTVTDSLLGSE